jgi:uncharacterized membrane-anchored protein YitT (DUF2179 family)
MSVSLFTLSGGIVSLGVELVFVEILLLAAGIASLILILATAANRAFRSFRIIRAPEGVYNILRQDLTQNSSDGSDFLSFMVLK